VSQLICRLWSPCRGYLGVQSKAQRGESAAAGGQVVTTGLDGLTQLVGQARPLLLRCRKFLNPLLDNENRVRELLQVRRQGQLVTARLHSHIMPDVGSDGRVLGGFRTDEEAAV